MPKDLASAGFIAITHKGTVVSLLGPDGPLYCASIEVSPLESGGPVSGIEINPQDSTSPLYRIEAVIPKREYILDRHGADSGATIDVPLDDIVPVAKSATPKDIKVGDEVLYRDDKGWHSETAVVADIRYRFEHLIRDRSGKVFSVIFDRDILGNAVSDGKATAKTRKAGRKRRARETLPGVSAVTSAAESVVDTV